MHRFEQFQPQVIQYFHSRHFLHNSGKNIRAHGVIIEMFAGNFYRFSQIPSDPVCTTITHIPVRSDAGSHIQQVADGHIGKICRNSIRNWSGKKEATRSVSRKRFSEIARPTAAPTKVLEQEYTVCRYSGAKGSG